VNALVSIARRTSMPSRMNGSVLCQFDRATTPGGHRLDG
jgi:hypothetical protein